MRRHLTVGGLAIAGLALLGTLAATPTAEASSAASVDGVWRSNGYSAILRIDRGRATVFETTGVSCLAGPVAEQAGAADRRGGVRFAGEELGFTVRPQRNGRELVQRMDGSVGERQLRRISELPADCAAPPATVFDIFWQTYAENYPFFAAKGVDWAQVREQYRPRVRPDMAEQELFDLLVEMIRPLGDAHTGIRAGEREFIGQRPGTTFPDLALEQRVRPYIERVHGPLENHGNGLIGYRDLPNGIGYLRLVAFAHYSEDGTYAADAAELDRALDAIFTRQRTNTLRGLVIDLRINGGGHDALGLRLAERLTKRPHFAYTKQARNDPDDQGAFTAAQTIRVEPSDRPAYTGPVAILTGGSTISAGETFVQATLERSPRPIRAGEHTQGVFSDTLARTLPNGWRFLLPNERFLTRDGRTFDGTGIPPDATVPVFTDEELASDRDTAFNRAIALLDRR